MTFNAIQRRELLKASGFRFGRVPKLTDEDVALIGQLDRRQASPEDVAKVMNVSSQTIRRVLDGCYITKDEWARHNADAREKHKEGLKFDCEPELVLRTSLDLVALIRECSAFLKRPESSIGIESLASEDEEALISRLKADCDQRLVNLLETCEMLPTVSDRIRAMGAVMEFHASILDKPSAKRLAHASYVLSAVASKIAKESTIEAVGASPGHHRRIA